MTTSCICLCIIIALCVVWWCGSYSPGVSEVLKFAWVQYLSLFLVTFFLLDRMNSFVFTHKVREGGRKGGREGDRETGRQGGRQGGREGGTPSAVSCACVMAFMIHSSHSCIVIVIVTCCHVLVDALCESNAGHGCEEDGLKLS
jgi:hypothetical protein